MLHEILLALSGHPSPLFDLEISKEDEFPLITPPERALLGSVGHLAHLHRTLKSNLSALSTSHPSVICRAVANFVLSSHLSQFQHLILDVERKILSKDPEFVGAYNTVPLAGVVKQFDGWKRRLEWYRDLTNVMLSKEPLGTGRMVCSGSGVIAYLRTSCKTGYADIAEAATQLECIADRIWIRLLSAWILHGLLSGLGSSDFFVQTREDTSPTQSDYTIDEKLFPPFLDTQTALSILFIGKTISFFEVQSRQTVIGSPSKSKECTSSRMQAMQQDHIQLLTGIDAPVKAAALSITIKQIRRSLSKRLADEVLPTHELIDTFGKLRMFFLGGQVDFFDKLIDRADGHIASRHLQLRGESRMQTSTDLAGVVMKQGEVTAILSRTWADLAPLVHKGELVEDDFEWGREHLCLTLSKYTVNEMKADKTTAVDLSKFVLGTFSDLLLSTPAMLNLELSSNFALFLQPADLQMYSVMHTYLLAIRRGQNHVTKLWRQGALRKENRRLILLKSKDPKGSFSHHCEQATKTSRAMRKLWGSSSTAVLVLCELGTYLINTVIASSWQKFHDWALLSDTSSGTNAATKAISLPDRSAAPETSSRPLTDSRHTVTPRAGQNADAEPELPRDPESLTTAHRLYLSALMEALLLTDVTFTRHLRSLLTTIDSLTGFAERLQQVQANLELYVGVDEANYLHTKLLREEEFLYSEAKKVTDRIDATIQNLIKTILQLSTTRSSSSGLMPGPDEFEPWESTGSLESLLVRLEFGA